MHQVQSSLIISTYNWPQALSLCLSSVLRQSVLPKEIIIADDGSTPETRKIIEKFQGVFNIPVVHVWHEDKGFQLAQIRNKAFASSSFEYLIQIDGDLILHPLFIADHLRVARHKCFVTGSRVLLSARSSKALLLNNSLSIRRYSSVHDKNFFNRFRNRSLSNFLANKYKQHGSNRYYVKGCNMAFWKKDIRKVNGYNESFTGWGREDSELAIRLINAGIKKRFLKLGGVTYHLHHSEASREMESTNTDIMQNAISQKMVWAEDGLDKYLLPREEAVRLF